MNTILGLSSGREYIEPRIYHNNRENNNITLVYRFISRVWSEDLGDWLQNYEEQFGSKIDILIINSCLWDVNRWGPTGPEDFKDNMETFVKQAPTVLPSGGLCIWLTAPPGG